MDFVEMEKQKDRKASKLETKDNEALRVEEKEYLKLNLDINGKKTLKYGEKQFNEDRIDSNKFSKKKQTENIIENKTNLEVKNIENYDSLYQDYLNK